MNLQHFQRFQTFYAALLLFSYVVINNTVNATTQIMEAQRDGVLPFLIWEPFVWEYSSAFSTLLIFPAVVWLLKKVPFDWHNIALSLCILSQLKFISLESCKLSHRIKIKKDIIPVRTILK